MSIMSRLDFHMFLAYLAQFKDKESYNFSMFLEHMSQPPNFNVIDED